MDVILSRAGLSATQQRSVCFDAVQDEVRHTEAKLTDAIASLKRLEDVVRIARDVHNVQMSVVTLPPDAEVSVKRMAQSSEQIGPMLREIQSMLNAFTLSSRSRGPSGYSTEEEDEYDEEVSSSAWTLNHERGRQLYAGAAASGPRDRATSRGSSGWITHSREEGLPPSSFFRVRDQARATGPSTPQVAASAQRATSRYTASDKFVGSTGYIGQKRRATSPPRSGDHSFLRPTTPGDLLIHREVERQSIWPKHHQYRMLHSRPRSPVQQSEKKVAQVIDGLEKRLSKLPEEEQGGVFFTSVKDALKIARLTRVKGEETSIQEAIDSAITAVNGLLDRNSSFPESDVQHHRLEDLRQVLSVVVRAVLDTNGKLEASGLRDMLDLIKKLQDTFPGSSARFKWCSTQLRKFITLKYKRPEQISLADQNKLSLVVTEARGWESVNDYTASRFGEVMAFVTEILEGSYEEWEPREDSQLAELIGIMIIRLGAFRDSHVQQGRLHEANGWLYKMSGSSFSPSLDLESVPPPQTSVVYVTTNQGFRSMEDVEDGFNRISKAQATKSFGFLTMTLYTFLATVVQTQNHKLLPIDELHRFNEKLEALKELNVEGERWAVLQSYQKLEKTLYLMRVLMHQRPDYVESSVGTVDTLLALFPPLKRPTFVYPSNIAPPEPAALPASEALVDEFIDE